MDVQKVNPDGIGGDIVTITDSESIERLTTAFEQVKWAPNVKAEMTRKEDAKATLFFEFNENMPERLFEYKVWFNQNEGTATLISNNEKEGYGELDKDNASILRNEILNKLTDWEVRNKYEVNQKVLFSIFPDPALSAGKPYGYMFSFNEPFVAYKGKELSIFAYHEETGERITALSSEKIMEPSSGYSSLNRFTTTFELPVGGKWRIEVVLDGKAYGDVIIEL